MTDTSNPAGVGASAMLAVDILRELARKDVETAAAYRGQDGADAIMGDYMAHAKALRYAANRLCSFEALASAPAPSHEHPIRDSQGGLSSTGEHPLRDRGEPVAWDFVYAAEAIGLYCGDEADEEKADTDPMEAAFDAFIAEHPLPYVEGKSPRVALAAAINAYLAPARTVATETERRLSRPPAESASLPPARVEEGPRVKALEFDESSGWPKIADTPFGAYKIWAGKDVWFGHRWIRDMHAPSYEVAKAWAQEDYEARIRGALE